MCENCAPGEDMETSEAYIEGCHAKLEGRAIDENPYDEADFPEDYEDWDAGYTDTELEHEVA